MTQPTINFASGDFPEPRPSEIECLTAAVGELVTAVLSLTAEVKATRQHDALKATASVGAEPDLDDAHYALVKRGAGRIGSTAAAKKTWADVPEGWVAELDPPRLLPEDVAAEEDIVPARPVYIKAVVCGNPFSEEGYDWTLVDLKDDHPLDEGWGGHIKQVEALGLTPADFRDPSIEKVHPSLEAIQAFFES